MKNIVQIAVFITLLTACSSSQMLNCQDVSLVNYNVPLHTDSIFTSHYRFVRFQNKNNESVITGIDRLLCADGYIFVVDRKGNHLLAFDQDGTFLKSTKSMIGRGKNEYISIFDATIDQTEKRIYAYCDAPCKLVVFDYDLNVIENIDFQTFTWELCVDDQYLYILSPDLENGSVIRLMRFDKKNLKGAATEILTTHSAIHELGTQGKSLIHSGDCYFAMPFEQMIYKIKDGEIVNSYKVEFKDSWFGKDGNNTGLSDFMRINRDKHWMITNICPSNSSLLFNTNKYHAFVLNLRTNICAAYKGIVDDHYIPISSRLIPVDGLYGQAVYEVNLESIKKYMDKNVDNDKGRYDPVLIKFALEYKRENNPTICIWSIR